MISEKDRFKQIAREKEARAKKRDEMDPYRGIEVAFVGKSQLKSHKGVVTGTQLNKGKKALKKTNEMAPEDIITVTVKTTTQTVNTIVQVAIKDLVDIRYYSLVFSKGTYLYTRRRSGLPLKCARWVPRDALPIWEQLHRQPSITISTHPSTQLNELPDAEEQLDSAWDPRHHLPGEEPARASSSRSLTVAVPVPGL